MNDLPNGTEEQNKNDMPDMLTKMPEMPKPAPKPANPLQQYYRQPKIFIKLPSRGRFYPDGALDSSETGDYAVFSMTAKDELMFKTPDALLNGQSTVEVIKSCIPAIKNPWEMPSIDVDAALIAIRVATYGDNMTISTDCPECDEENDYSLNLVNYIESMSAYEYQDEIQVGELTVFIQPYTYKEITKAAIKAIEQEKIFSIVNNEELSDEEKIAQFGESFIKLTHMSVDIIADSIVKVVTPQAEVTDHEMIMDFINNANKDVFNTIKSHIEELKNKVEIKSHKVKCVECEHGFETTITMDQANFFGVRS